MSQLSPVEHGESVVSPLRFEFVGRSDKGLVRSRNEDAFGILPEEGMVVIADGMGGYRGGEIASQIAVDAVLHHLLKRVHQETPLDRCLDEAERAIDQANQAMWKAVADAPELRGMGTTVIVGVFREGGLGFAWVGDSRLYLLRDQQLIQLSTDHTLVQELVNQQLFESVEAAIAAGVGGNILTRALGTEEPLLIDVGSMDLTAGDIVLFCSDGLNHMIDGKAIEGVLSTSRDDLDDKADRLVQLAREAGGRDNITLVLVAVMTASEDA